MQRVPTVPRRVVGQVRPDSPTPLHSSHGSSSNLPAVDEDRPWRWYCRIDGEEGSCPTEDERNQAAKQHMSAAHPDPGYLTRSAVFGHLLHVWPVPIWAYEGWASPN